LAAGAVFVVALVAGAALVAFVADAAGVGVAFAADPRPPTALRAVAAACLATDNAILATM
jgi:hypothetical protein